MIIQSNIVAMNNMMQLTRTNQNMKKSVERLSSGYRINRAADDAAGLAVSEKNVRRYGDLFAQQKMQKMELVLCRRQMVL